MDPAGRSLAPPEVTARIRDTLRKMGVPDPQPKLFEDLCAMNHAARKRAYAQIRKELRKLRKRAG